MSVKKESSVTIEKVLNNLNPNINLLSEVNALKYIYANDLKKLSCLNIWLGYSNIAKEYIFILGAAFICEYYFHPILYVITIIWIGARQHALGIIGHDAVHYRLHKNKKINDIIGDFFCLNPLFITIEGYRREHLSHHKFVGTIYDIDWLRIKDYSQYNFPQSKLKFIGNITKHLLGLFTVRDFYNLLITCKFILNVSKKSYFTMFSYYIILFSLLFYFEGAFAYLMYWFVPSISMLIACLYFRLIAEHSHIEKGGLLNTRNIIPYWWENLLISPNGVNYHLDHHLCPSVPFYNLRILHTKLNESENYIKSSVNLKGYSNEFLLAIS